MHGKVGDRLVVLGAHVSDHAREGVIIEVHGVEGGPPYLIRWANGDHESLVFPGPGTQILAAEAESA